MAFDEDMELSTMELLLHQIVEEFASPGIVVDREKALRTKCICYKLPGRDICFSKGVIGILTKEQEEELCVAGKIYKVGGVTRRLAKFGEAADACRKEMEAYPKEKRFRAWITCMGRELKDRGVEI